MKRLALLTAAFALLLLCACTGPVSPAPSSSPTAAPATATPEPTAAPTAAPTPASTESPAPTDAPVEADRTLAANGKEYPACLFSGALSEGGEPEFTCVLPLEAVEADYEHNAWVFRCAGEPEALLELSFIAGGDVESLLPGFMDGYLEFTEIEFSETSALGSLRGEVGRVSASGPERMAEGWLLDVEGGTVSAVLLCPKSAPQAEALLRAMLETFALG